ncbi:MAG: ribosome biogenesis GTPase Der, partial [Alphaproteobacteria bacterium]
GAAGLLEAWELGLGDPIPVSAEHGEGLGDLYDAIRSMLQALGLDEEEDEVVVDEGMDGVDADAEDDPERPIRLAIIGRPNVGKSTLMNQILGVNRVLTGPKPGVTRDAISVDFEWRDRKVKLFDTAGMRRRARVHDRVEKKSVDDTFDAVRFADVTALIFDASTGLERQDLTIALHAVSEGRALILGANKWDAVEDREEALERIKDRIMTSLPDAKGVSVTTLSGLTGQRVDRLLDASMSVYDLWNKRISTGNLNRWLADVVARHPPPLFRGRRPRLRYMTQIKRRPPTFALFGVEKGALPETYIRYLANDMRQRFDFPGVPLRFHLRRSDNPYK